MAAYAALTSLMDTLNQVHNYGQQLIFLDDEQIESLSHKVRFLLEFLENYSNIDSGNQAEILDNQIADAAYAAEDVIESRIVNCIFAGSHDLLKSCSAEFCNLNDVIENLDTVKKRVMDITTESQRSKVQKPEYSMPARSSQPTPSGKITVIGLQEESIRIMDWLTGLNPARQIISILGMGGIGKTTLVRSVNEKPIIMQHFDVHIWVTVSQQYSKHKILLGMVACLEGKESGDGSEISRKDENQLGELLHKSLSGRRYLVVMDDVWSIEAWDMVRFFLPDNGNRSRVIVTTRNSKMATHFGPYRHKMDFLDKDTSWDLFCEKAFGQERCPREFEEVGKAIVDKCKGLPLSIVVIAGLLANSSRTQEHWKYTFENLNSIVNTGDDEYCMKLLSLSYNHLPTHLKPCFLYMSLFPEDHEIRVTELVHLFVAEGFLKPNGSKSWEEVAEGYLLDLVDRNLVLVSSRRYNGRVKACRIHDLLRDLCVRIVPQGRFICLTTISGHKNPQDIYKERRIVVHEPRLRNVELRSTVESPTCNHTQFFHEMFQFLESASLCRSLLGDCDDCGYLSSCSLLRVLSINVDIFSPKSVLKLSNLRYLAFRRQWLSDSLQRSSILPSVPSYILPSTMSLLWNVRTIICRELHDRFVLPSEIWCMPQLRHIEFDEICLPDPPSNQFGEGNDCFVLDNLEVLSNVAKFRCDEDMVKRIPNLKKLKISYYNIFYKGVLEAESYASLALAGSYYSLRSLSCLDKLESLNLWFAGSPQQDDLIHKVTFPHSLKKLTLTGTRLEWADLTTIGSLPHLEFLALEMDSCVGSQWNPVEEEFLCLKVLKVHYSELKHLNADETHFPELERLVLKCLPTLDEIPLSIGYISTLTYIDLYLCSDSSVMSAKEIADEQESNGNDKIQVRVTFQNSAELENLMVKMELESLASDNFQVTVLAKS